MSRLSWSGAAEWILRHGGRALAFLAVLTVGMAYWAAQVQTDHRGGTFVSAESESEQTFQRVARVFGQSQSILYLVFEAVDPTDPAFLTALDSLTERVQTYEGVEHVLSLPNAPYLTRQGRSVVARPLYADTLDQAELRRRFDGQPFLRGLLLSSDGAMAGMLVKVDEAFNDRPERIDLVNRVRDEAQQLPGEIAMAGFPYLRTAYAERVTAEAPRFTLLANSSSRTCASPARSTRPARAVSPPQRDRTCRRECARRCAGGRWRRAQ